MKRPFLLLYINDFLGSPVVQAMDDAQFRWYLQLLMRAWQYEIPCHLPNSDKELMMYAGCKNEKQWQAKKGLVIANFDATEDGKYLTNARLIAEYEKMCVISEKRADAAKVKAAKALQNSANAEICKPFVMQNSATQTQTQTQTQTKTRKIKAAPTLRVTLPSWVAKEVWDAFVEMRNRVRKPLTDEGARLLLLKLDTLRNDGNDPSAVLRQSIMNSWQGVFELKDRKQQPYAVKPSGANYQMLDPKDRFNDD